MIWLVLGACREPPASGDRPSHPTDSGTTSADCALPLASGGLDEDCNGTAAATVPLAAARRLEVRGGSWDEFGTSVACSSERVGTFETAIAAGGLEWDDESGDLGWTVMVDPSRTGSITVEEADLVIRGVREHSDALGYRVVFPGDVDGDGDGELLATAITAYRPDALTGAAFLFHADERGAITADDAAVWFQGGEVQAMLGGATRAGDLDGDGLAEVVLGYTYMNLFDAPGFIAIHRGKDFPEQVPPGLAEAKFDAIDPFQATGATMLVADVTGDGTDDLVTGEYDWIGPFSGGRVLVLAGPLTDVPVRSLGDALTFEGEFEASSTGTRLASGDLNNDGFADLAVSAPVLTSSAGERAGRAYVFFGPLDGSDTSVTDADVIIDGETAFSWLSTGIAILDHDGDGHDDLALGAASDPYFGPPRPGLIYVFAGPLESGTLDPANDSAVVYEDDLMLTTLGYAMDGCDLDGDGDEELVVGAPDAGFDDAPMAGRVQVVDGGPWRSPVP